MRILKKSAQKNQHKILNASPTVPKVTSETIIILKKELSPPPPPLPPSMGMRSRHQKKYCFLSNNNQHLEDPPEGGNQPFELSHVVKATVFPVTTRRDIIKSGFGFGRFII